MLTFKEHPDSDIFEITVDGFVDADEFQEVVDRLEVFIGKHGKVRLLEHVKSFGGMDIGVFWNDMVFALNHMRDFSRCAVVSDQSWVAWFSKTADMMTSCDIRCFSDAQMDEAMAWLQENVHKAPEGLA